MDGSGTLAGMRERSRRGVPQRAREFVDDDRKAMSRGRTEVRLRVSCALIAMFRRTLGASPGKHFRNAESDHDQPMAGSAAPSAARSSCHAYRCRPHSRTAIIRRLTTQEELESDSVRCCNSKKCASLRLAVWMSMQPLRTALWMSSHSSAASSLNQNFASGKRRFRPSGPQSNGLQSVLARRHSKFAPVATITKGRQFACLRERCRRPTACPLRPVC